MRLSPSAPDRAGAGFRRARASAGRGAATELGANAEIDPSAFALLPPALARIEHRERRNPEALRQRRGRFGRRGSGGRIAGAAGVLVPQRSRPVERIQDAKEVGVAEAEHVEIEFLLAQSGQFGTQHRLVPTCVLCDLVVGDHKRPPLRFAQMIEHDHQHLGEAEQLRGENAAVAGDDHVVGADQHRIEEAEFGDRCGDLRDLILRMRPRIANVGDQAVERSSLDRERAG